MIFRFLNIIKMKAIAIKKSFKIHIWGYSAETVEVDLFLQDTESAMPVVESFFRNIHDYFTAKLGLHSENLYIYIDVE
jgi:hypothetical protein